MKQKEFMDYIDSKLEGLKLETEELKISNIFRKEALKEITYDTKIISKNIKIEFK